MDKTTHIISEKHWLEAIAEKDRVRYIQLQSFKPELLTEYERAFMNIYSRKLNDRS
jgi:hypothetical protein